MKTSLLLLLVACGGKPDGMVSLDSGTEVDAPGTLSCDTPTWRSEVIADGNAGTFTTYRLDSQGGEHVLYRNATTNKMVYATRANASTWRQIALPAACSSVIGDRYIPVEWTANQNLAIAPDDRVYVSCKNAVYSRALADATWTTTMLPPVFTNLAPDNFLRTQGSSIATGTDGALHLVTIDEKWETAPDELRGRSFTYWKRTQDAWSPSTISFYLPGTPDGLNMHGTRIALCADATGPRISGPGDTQVGPAFVEARPATGTQPWTTATLRFYGFGVAQGSGYQAACAIDAQGRAFHVHYDYGYEGSVNLLEVFRKGAGDPISVFTENGARFPDIAVDRSRVFVSYNLGDTLRLAILDGSDAATFDVDSDGVGQHTSLVVDSHGLPRIAYYDHAEARLKLAVASCD